MAVCVSARACRRRGCSRRISPFQGTPFLMPTSDSLSLRIPEATESKPAERVALARCEVCERHLIGATYAGVHVVNLAGEPVWRQRFDHSIRIKERPIDPLWRGLEDAVKTDSAGHDSFSFQ